VADQAEPFEQARLLYEQAVFGGDDAALPAADVILDAAEAGLALARGRIMHARFLAHRQEDPQELALFERAAALYHQLGDIRGEGESLFWVGTFHQVVRGDDDAAGPPLERAWSLAQTPGPVTVIGHGRCWTRRRPSRLTQAPTGSCAGPARPAKSYDGDIGRPALSQGAKP